MGLDVFLSVGGTANQKQEDFVQAVEARLRAEGLIPNTVGRNTFSADAPLKTVEHLMDKCAGTVVLALERLYFPFGVEKRGGGKERSLTEARLATPWNQIEAAMSYSRGLPLLVIVEEGVVHDGLLEPGYDWYVQTVKLEVSHLNTPEFNGVLASWKDKIRTSLDPSRISEKAARPAVEEMTIAQLIGALKPYHLWSILVAFGAILAAVFSIGAKLLP